MGGYRLQTWRKAALAALGLLVAGLAGGPALANDAGIQIMSQQLHAASAGAEASGFGQEDEPRLAVSFGRAADIEGTLVDFSRMRRPAKPGADGKPASGKSGSSKAGLSYAGAFAWPSRLPLNSSVLTSRFGSRYHPILGLVRQHSGADLAAAAGTPVKAPSPGVVVAAQWQGGYGLLVVVDHGKGVQTRCAHLSQVAVYPGQQVGLGDVLGYVGSTGLATGPHLHYEMRLNGQAVDPIGATAGR